MGEKLASGHTVVKFEEEEAENLKKKFFLLTDGAIKLQPEGWVLPNSYIKFSKLIHAFEAKPSDIFVLGFPKSGTTWMQEIVWNLVHNRNLDNLQASVPIDKRIIHLEGDVYLAVPGVPPPDPQGLCMKLFERLCPGESPSDGILLKLASYLPPPRTIKTHLPVSLLPDKTLETSKVIYVIREVRDVIISFYHYAQHQNLLAYKGTLDDFIDDIVNDRIQFGPYWHHLSTAWEKKDNPNLCLVFYEDLKSDIAKEIKRIDTFLGTNLTETQIEGVICYTSFNQMKERFNTNQKSSNKHGVHRKDFRTMAQFFRKGEVGDWKDKFTSEQLEKIDTWMAKNLHSFQDFRYNV